MTWPHSYICRIFGSPLQIFCNNCSFCFIVLTCFIFIYVCQGWGQVQYLYLSTYLSVLDVLEYLVYGNVKVLVLVLVLDQKVLGTCK